MRFINSLISSYIAMGIIFLGLALANMLGIGEYIYLLFCLAALIVLFIGRNLLKKGHRGVGLICYGLSLVFLWQAFIM